jgi:hypothetical protein
LVAIEKGERRVTSSELIQVAEIYAPPVSELVSQRQNREPFAPQFRVAAQFKNVQDSL